MQRRLRAERPSPPQDFLDDLALRISRSALDRHTGFRRVGVTVLAAAVILAILGAFGGVGFASSGVAGAAASTVNAVSTLVSPDKKSSVEATSSSPSQRNGNNGNGNGDNDDECEDDNDDGAAEGEYCPPRVTICHVKRNGKEKTLTLRPRAAARHLNNHPNDYAGPCRHGDDDDD